MRTNYEVRTKPGSKSFRFVSASEDRDTGKIFVTTGHGKTNSESAGAVGRRFGFHEMVCIHGGNKKIRELTKVQARGFIADWRSKQSKAGFTEAVEYYR